MVNEAHAWKPITHGMYIASNESWSSEDSMLATAAANAPTAEDGAEDLGAVDGDAEEGEEEEDKEVDEETS